MIISASRRTDIPAFYAEWLVNRLRQGYVLVRNPMNSHQVSHIELTPATVDGLVFWTKDPRPLMARLPEITRLGFPCHFLYTLTAYDERIEQEVPPLAERLETFQALAGRIGKKNVSWRYDPIFFTGRCSADFHREAFADLAERLAGSTLRCVVSFLQLYRKCQRNLKGLDLIEPPVAERVALLRALQEISAVHGIALQTCAQGGELAAALGQAGIAPARCIDGELLGGTAAGRAGRKDKNQRQECGCQESIDIGAYDSCPHHCLYCYANNDLRAVAKNFAAHSPESPLLYGCLGPQDRVTVRKIPGPAGRQPRLFEIGKGLENGRETG